MCIDEFIENRYILECPEYISLITKINDFLKINFKNYEFKYCFKGLFFIYKKGSENQIIELLHKY
jgi:hypothetical protein